MAFLGFMESQFMNSQPYRNFSIIFKIAERCNINCTYCYVFNGNDESYKQRPALVAEPVTERIANFLAEGCKQCGIANLSVVFHGGEPLLIGKERFARMCQQFQTILASVTKLDLRVQTNGMLVDEEWIEIFERYQLKVGVSLDGPKDYHDEKRIDFTGRGTYDQTVVGLKRLLDAVSSKRISPLGVLALADTGRSAQRIYQHIVHDLGIRRVDFLLPDLTYDMVSPGEAKRYGTFLCEAFDAWVADQDDTIDVRILGSALSLLLGGRSGVDILGLEGVEAITIQSDGSLGPDDKLRTCGPEMMDSGHTVFNSSLANFLQSSCINDIERARLDRAPKCLNCCWLNVCGGGALINRYKAGEGFRNPSVLCDALKEFFAHVANYLLANGLPPAHLLKVLASNDSQLPEEQATLVLSGAT